MTKKPPVSAPESEQYDLFSSFFGNEKELSNTIEFWDSVPKYCVSKRVQNNLRDESGRLPVYEQVFHYHASPKSENAPVICKLTIQPASIKTGEGFTDFYPSANEHLIEEVLKKIFSDQRYGLHDVAQSESWVKFTLYMIQKELKARGKTRSITEIKQSLEVLARAVYEIQIKGQRRKKLLYTNPILNDLTRVTRDDYEDDPQATWCARLPTLISKSINGLTFRQYNYGRLMQLSNQLAWWFYLRLSHEFTNANLMTPYKTLYTTIERDSGLLNKNSKSKNIQAVDEMLQELKDNDVILTWDTDKRFKGRQILDVLYTITPSSNFVKEVKAANARAAQNKRHDQYIGGKVDKLP